MQKIEVPTEVQAVLVKEEIDEQSGQSLIARFGGYNDQINAALETSKTITSGETLAAQKVAKTCRLELRRIRCDVEKTRKAAKADALRYGKAVDGLANVFKFLCEPEEKRLEDIEKHAERIEQARIEQLVSERSEALIAVDADPAAYNLETMDDETFTATLQMAKKLRDERIEAERKAEADRIAKEKAEAAERERIIEENKRLKEEAEAREKEAAKERAKVEAERKRIEAERAKERAEYEAKQRAEAEAREKAEREALEQKRKVEAEARRIAKEKKDTAIRPADENNLRAIKNAAYLDIVNAGIEKQTAKKFVELVTDEKIRNIKMVW